MAMGAIHGACAIYISPGLDAEFATGLEELTIEKAARLL
jgi:hypothetical protein